MWTNFFDDGGWGMYPTSLFSFLLLASVALYLLRPQHRFLPALGALLVATLGAGVLGATVGIVNTLRGLPALPPDEQLRAGVIGCAESLNNAVLALMVATLSGFLTALGALRGMLSSRPGR